MSSDIEPGHNSDCFRVQGLSGMTCPHFGTIVGGAVVDLLNDGLAVRRTNGTNIEGRTGQLTSH
jgi:hypothetical protein